MPNTNIIINNIINENKNVTKFDKTAERAYKYFGTYTDFQMFAELSKLFIACVDPPLNKP